jgi:hypothetical protein
MDLRGYGATIGGVLFVGFIILSVWLRFAGCERPACRVIDAYMYRVKSVNEYAEYVNGVDLYARHRASSLRFSCDAFRDQLTAAMHETLVTAGSGGNEPLGRELQRLELAGAKRQGKTLHLTRIEIDRRELAQWAEQVRVMLHDNADTDSRQSPAPVIRRLFSSVVLHADGDEIVIPLQVDARLKCDR